MGDDVALSILHLSKSPVAWAPHRICSALNRLPDYQAQWVIPKVDDSTADMVIAMEQQPERVIAAAQAADVIHLHNGVLLDEPAFKPLNLLAMFKQGKAFVRHYHSTPQTASYNEPAREREMLSDGVPSVVIAQYPERFFPDSYVVPNLIGTDLLGELKPAQRDIDLSFMPSKMVSAWSSRWDTKAMPQSHAILKRWSQQHGLRYEAPRQRAWSQVMDIRSRCRVCCDDLVTGSYHLAALESMLAGSVALNYLDDRSDFLLRYMAGASQHPLISVPYEQLTVVLERLWSDLPAMEELGAASRQWIQDYWADMKQIERFVAMYRLLLESPDKLTRQDDLKHTTKVQIQLAQAENTYESRRRAGYAQNLRFEFQLICKRIVGKLRSLTRKKKQS